MTNRSELKITRSLWSRRRKTAKIMDGDYFSSLTSIRRLLLFAALITQAVMFALYPSIYWENRVYNLLILLAVPTVLTWLAVLKVYDRSEQLQSLWMVWGVYVIIVFCFVVLLIPMVCLLYDLLREPLDMEGFFGPTVVVMITCCSPGIALILLISGNATEDKILDLFIRHYGCIIIEITYHISLLAVFAQTFQLSSVLEDSVIVFVFWSLFISTAEMARLKIKNRETVYSFRFIFQSLLLNLALLVIRLIVWLKYKDNTWIFTIYNFIKIVFIVVFTTIIIVRLIRRCRTLGSVPEDVYSRSGEYNLEVMSRGETTPERTSYPFERTDPIRDCRFSREWDFAGPWP